MQDETTHAWTRKEIVKFDVNIIIIQKKRRTVETQQQNTSKKSTQKALSMMASSRTAIISCAVFSSFYLLFHCWCANKQTCHRGAESHQFSCKEEQ